MSGKPLKMKDLIPVRFTPLGDDKEAKKALIAQERRYKCPVTHDVLANSVPCVVIKPTYETAKAFSKSQFLHRFYFPVGQSLQKNVWTSWSRKTWLIQWRTNRWRILILYLCSEWVCCMYIFTILKWCTFFQAQEQKFSTRFIKSIDVFNSQYEPVIYDPFQFRLLENKFREISLPSKCPSKYKIVLRNYLENLSLLFHGIGKHQYKINSTSVQWPEKIALVLKELISFTGRNRLFKREHRPCTNPR